VRVAVYFVDEAVGELDDAVLWYQERRDGLGLAFLAALDGAVESIERWPRAGSLVNDVAEELEVRRAQVPRFPYFVAYLVSDERVVVLAVAHERRRPRYWSSRAES
jgi:plasmid stabilization system protein ParE